MSVRPFPLVPQRRFAGVQFGDRRSPRRGPGDEVVGSRPYRPGDLTAWIDWRASARLSAARGTDEFVVREFLAEQAPRVVVVRDRRPAMALYGADGLPWLDKRAAADEAVRQIGLAAAAERGELAYADHGTGKPFWIPPRGNGFRELLERRDRVAPFAGPADALHRSLELALRHGPLFPVGTFAFVVSDFLAPVPARTWLRFRALAWDVTPVIVQDPVWEQDFPDVGGVALPVADPETGTVRDAWISPKAARARAAAHRDRIAGLRARFTRLGFDPVLVSTADPHEIETCFHAWSERRRRLRRTRA